MKLHYYKNHSAESSGDTDNGDGEPLPHKQRTMPLFLEKGLPPKGVEKATKMLLQFKVASGLSYNCLESPLFEAFIRYVVYFFHIFSPPLF